MSWRSPSSLTIDDGPVLILFWKGNKASSFTSCLNEAVVTEGHLFNDALYDYANRMIMSLKSKNTKNRFLGWMPLPPTEGLEEEAQT